MSTSPVFYPEPLVPHGANLPGHMFTQASCKIEDENLGEMENSGDGLKDGLHSDVPSCSAFLNISPGSNSKQMLAAKHHRAVNQCARECLYCSHGRKRENGELPSRGSRCVHSEQSLNGRLCLLWDLHNHNPVSTSYMEPRAKYDALKKIHGELRVL